MHLQTLLIKLNNILIFLKIFEVTNYCVSYQCLNNFLFEWSPVIKICACVKNSAFEKYNQTKTGLQFEIPKCCDEIPKIIGCSKDGQKILEAYKVKCESGEYSKHYNNITFNKTHILATHFQNGNTALTGSDNFCIGPTWNKGGQRKSLQVEMDLYVCRPPPCNNETPCLRLS